jgi:hypothetical protein
MAFRNLFWTGLVSSDFGTAGNWNDTTDNLNPAALAPTSIDSISFSTGPTNITGSGTVDGAGFDGGLTWTLNGGTITDLGFLNVAIANNATLDVIAGGTLADTGSGVYLALNSGLSAALNVSGNHSLLSTASGVTVGAGTNSVGSLAVTNGGSYVGTAGTYDFFGSNSLSTGYGTVDGTGST